MYLQDTKNKIALTHCPELVAFVWDRGRPRLARYAYNDNVTFTVTFQNLDPVDDHTLDFTYEEGGTIAADDITISPSPVTIPAGDSEMVTFTFDLSNPLAYPIKQQGNWYGYYYVNICVYFGDIHATTMYFRVSVLPEDETVIPKVWLPCVELGNRYEVFNMRIYTGIDGPLKTSYPGIDPLQDTYYCDWFLGYMCLDRIWDEKAFTTESFTHEASEMRIFPDGSVEFIDNCWLTDGLSDIQWVRTWYFTHDDPWVKVTDNFTNYGTKNLSFSYSILVNNFAEPGARAKVPGVYDKWTSLHPEYMHPIFADEMTVPVIYECDSEAQYSSKAPGAFGAVVFVTEVPKYNSSGVSHEETQAGVAFFNEYFSYRLDLAPSASKSITVYSVCTGSCPNAERYLYDAVYFILSPSASVSLIPKRGATAFTVEGQGFLYYSGVTITWDGIPIAMTTTDGAGKFSITTSVPDQTAPGDHTVEVGDGVNFVPATFTVIDMTGLPGPQGPTGATGPQGPEGPPGITPAEIADLTARIAELEKKLSELLGPASSPGIVSVPAGGTQTIGVEKTAITELTFFAIRAIEGTVTVQELKARPVGLVKVAAPGVVYKYLNISSENIAAEDVEKVLIEFQVERSWVASEDIDEGTITLCRYNAEANEWTSLPTEKIGEDATYLYFSAESPGLSVFTVIGSRVKPFPWALLATVIAVLIIAVAAIGIWYKRRR